MLFEICVYLLAGLLVYHLYDEDGSSRADCLVVALLWPVLCVALTITRIIMFFGERKNV